MTYSLEWKTLLVCLALCTQGGCDRAPQEAHVALPPEINPGHSVIRVEVGAGRAFYDSPISLKVSGVSRDRPILLRTQATDANGASWESVATFAATQDGSVGISKQPSAEGSYTGVDALGPFWSMTPKEDVSEFSVEGDFSITISVERDGVQLGGGELERLAPLSGRDVRREEIRKDGLVGDLYLPAARGHHPALILLGGSDGEPMKARASLLAVHGFVVLNLFYFGHPSLPERFVGIPLDYFDRAVSWLKDHEEVQSQHLGVVGHSRGAEGALLLGTIRPDLKAIVAVAPSAVVWPGPNPKDCFRSAWTHQSRDVSFVPVDLVQGVTSLLRKAVSKESVDDHSLFAASLKNIVAVQSAAIPVEKSRAAILLISGKDDRVWPAAEMAEMVIKRLADHQHSCVFRRTILRAENSSLCQRSSFTK
jgi:dienelactone hydrolase